MYTEYYLGCYWTLESPTTATKYITTAYTYGMGVSDDIASTSYIAPFFETENRRIVGNGKVTRLVPKDKYLFTSVQILLSNIINYLPYLCRGHNA